MNDIKKEAIRKRSQLVPRESEMKLLDNVNQSVTYL